MTRPVAAAFDFDGTITRRDTLAPFLMSFAGRDLMGAAIGLVAALRPDGRHRRDRAKSAVTRGALRGRTIDDLEAAGRVYAERLVGEYRPATLELIDRHRADGHHLVMVTASLGCYARPAGEALGFDHVIAVELEVHDGISTGNIVGDNVRGPEKAVRLRAHLARTFPGVAPELYAYGNSAGDAELLAMADHARWIGRPPT